MVALITLSSLFEKTCSCDDCHKFKKKLKKLSVTTSLTALDDTDTSTGVYSTYLKTTIVLTTILQANLV